MKKPTIIAVGVTVGLVFLGGAMFAQNISNTGPESNNQITQNNNQNCKTTNSTNVNVSNQKNQSSTTGEANGSNNTNTGSSTTGNASNSSSSNTNVNVKNEDNCIAAEAAGKGSGGSGGVEPQKKQAQAPVGGVAAGDANVLTSIMTLSLFGGSVMAIILGAKHLKKATDNIK